MEVDALGAVAVEQRFDLGDIAVRKGSIEDAADRPAQQLIAGAEISRRFPRFRLRQCRCAQGLVLSWSAPGGSTFNSPNAYILKGDFANNMNLTFASLMTRALDEPDAVYPLAAQDLTVSSDRLLYRFRLRPGIRFHDGTDIAAADVVYFAEHAEDQGAPGLFLGVARACRRSSRPRTLQTVHLAVLRPRPVGSMRAALACVAADLLGNIFGARPFDETSLAGAARLRSLSARRASSRGAMSNSSGSKTGGAKIFPSRADSIISTSCVTNTTAIARSAWKPSSAAIICSARSSPRGSGRHATTSRRFATAASSARSFPTSAPRARRAGCSTQGADKFAYLRLRDAMVIAFDFERTKKTLMYETDDPYP